MNDVNLVHQPWTNNLVDANDISTVIGARLRGFYDRFRFHVVQNPDAGI